MTRIGLLSDTHGYWDERYAKYFSQCDEIWHAGDIGSSELADRLSSIKKITTPVPEHVEGQNPQNPQNSHNPHNHSEASIPAQFNCATPQPPQAITFRAVFGNIDGYDIRHRFSEKYRFKCEDVDVLIKHIGGYPGNYDASIRGTLFTRPPKLFISGHSHILKVMYDKTLNMLHINPGAAGISGFHKQRTLIRFTINGTEIQDLEVIELN